MEEEVRSIKFLAKNNNCYFVHSVVNHLSLGARLARIILLRQTMSTSSLRPDTNDWTIGPRGFGILLKGGVVLAGMPHDMGTLAIGVKERHSIFDDIASSTISIERAINSPVEKPKMIDEYNLKDGQHNELVVEYPEVAGVCLKWFDGLPLNDDIEIFSQDEYFRGLLEDHSSVWRWFKIVHSLNIPLFLLTPDNHVRKLYDINFIERSFRVSVKWNPGDIVEAGLRSGEGEKTHDL